MRSYEAVVLYRHEEENWLRGKEAVQKEFARVNAEIESEEDMRVRDLAYPVKKETRGHYTLYNLKIDPQQVAELDRTFKLMDEVLKFLFVNKEAK
jgi:small subunit ribosomal protein S6